MDTQPEILNLYIYEQGRDGFVFPLDTAPLPMFTTELDDTLFQAVNSPDDADFIIVPYPLDIFVNAVGLQNVATYCTTFPFFETHPRKHVYFLRHDDSRPTGLPGVIFRVGANARYQDEQTIPMPYQTADLGDIAPADFSALPYDTGFLGFAGLTDLRPRMADSVRAETRLAAKVVLRDEFYGHVAQRSEEAQRAYRAEFLEALAQSRTILCPRGEGEGSIRFFETMSAGRIPVMLADEYALPFADVIDYDAFMLRIPQRRVDETGAILADWLAAHTPAELQKMGQMARRAWEEYLSPSQLPCQVWRSLHRIKLAPSAPIPLPPTRQTTGKFWGAWQILFAHARALPRHSHIVAITAETAPVATLAHGLAAARNTDTRLTVIPVPETLTDFPADVVRLTGNPIVLREKFPVRSVNLLFLGGFSSVRAMSRLLEEWFITLAHGGTVIADDATPDKSVARAAEDFARETGYFIYSELFSLSGETVFQLEYTAAAEFKQLFGMPPVPPVPVTHPPATPIARMSFAGDAPPATLPAVSLCMIVKNEEANLADCLRSVGDFAAEIIVVDTGSTDRTVEIARRFGAQVYHFPWVDDFAAARNESLRHATGDWIFWLDADDRIPPSSLVKLKQAVASGRADAYRCRMVSPLTGEHPAVNSVFYTLLFRNHRGVKFEGAIHESPTDSVVRQGLRLANTNITIEHHGYAGDAADVRRKAERNVRILRRCIAAEPESLKWRYHLGVSLYQLGDFAGAVAQLEPIVMHPAPALNETNQVYRAHVLLLSAYANTGLTTRADALIAQATRRYPLRRHLWIAIGMHHLHQNRPRDAVSALEKARAIPAHTVEGEDWQPGVLESLLATAYRQWAAVLLQGGDALSAAEIVQQAIAVAQQPAQKSDGWKLLAVCLQRLGQESEAMTAWQMAQQMIAEPA